MPSTTDRIIGLLRSIAGALFNPGKSAPPRTRPGSKPAGKPGARAGSRPAQRPASNTPAAGLHAPYPGDFSGTSTVSYAPKPDGAADPGEIVWTWVPYEEDYSQGKDRPVLVVGRSGRRLLALMLTSKDHSNDRRGDDDYVDIGTGSWDRQGRPSEVKLDRVLQVAEADLRREGAVLDAKRFAAVATGLRRRHGWK
ncbi:type II toxin-antitoxin system PemK/MazF family toxin [Arthrobacter sp. TMN-49]